jgi:hypothetical protein
VTMIKGKSPDYIKKMSDSIYEALVELKTTEFSLV